MAPFRNLVDPALAESYREQGWWGDDTVGSWVEHWAAATPDADAFVTPDDRMTWAAYLAHARRLAGVLAAAGLEAGARVGLLLPDSAAVHVAFVACELAGITVVGIGHRAGDRELEHVMGRAGADALVSLADDVSRPAPVARRIVIPRFESDPEGEIVVDGRVTDPVDDIDGMVGERRLGPDDLFLLNTTSGTTGLPKCVMHTQNRWMFFHRKAVESGRLGLDGPEVVLGAVPAPFGFGLWTAHVTPAVLGATVVTFERFSADLALSLIEREKATMLAAVSTQFVMMLSSPALDGLDLSSLRVMFTGGEAVPYEKAVAFEERTGATVLQFFGSNETGLLTGTRLGDPTEARLRTAGRAAPEMQVRLYDESGAGTWTAGPGRGIPACRGPATCIGYLDDPAANAELVNPDGWMLMADVCEVDDEGWLRVVGRKSDIIIRGGKNISAAQVEDEVASHPRVRIAAAVAMADPVFGERVCVFVEASGPLTLSDVTDHLRARGTSKELLPERLVVLDSLPRSSGGKVAKGDLRALVDQPGFLSEDGEDG